MRPYLRALVVPATKSLPVLADSPNAIKTAKRELTFREILLLLQRKSGARCSVAFSRKRVQASCMRVYLSVFLFGGCSRLLNTFRNYRQLLRLQLFLLVESKRKMTRALPENFGIFNLTSLRATSRKGGSRASRPFRLLGKRNEKCEARSEKRESTKSLEGQSRGGVNFAERRYEESG